MPSRLVLLCVCTLLLGSNAFPSKASGQDLNFEIPDDTAELFVEGSVGGSAKGSNESRATRPLPSTSWLWLIVPGLVGWACWAQSRRDAAESEAGAMSWHNAKLQEKADAATDLNTQLAHLQTQSADREAEFNTAKQQLLSRIKDADASAESLRAENQNLQRSLQTHSNASNPKPDIVKVASPKLVAQCESQQIEIGQLNDELQKLRAKNTDLQKSLESQQQTQLSSESEKSNLAATCENQQLQCESQQIEIGQLHDHLQKLQADNARLQQTLESQQQTQLSSESERSNLAATCENQQLQLSELKQQLQIAQQEEQGRANTLSQLQQHTQSVGQQLNETLGVTDELKKQLVAHEEQVAQLQNNLSGERNANVELKLSLEQAQQRLSQSQAAHRADTERLQSSYGEMNSLKQQLSSAAAIQQASETERSELRAQIDALANQVEESKPTAPSAAQIRSRLDKTRRPAARRPSAKTAPAATKSKRTNNETKPKPKSESNRKSTSPNARMRTAAKVSRKPSKPSQNRRKSVAKKTAKNATGKKADRLTKIDGIGPKTEAILNAAGITSYRDLVKTKQNRLRAILDQAGSQFARIDPSKWPTQAANAIRDSTKRKPIRRKKRNR